MGLKPIFRALRMLPSVKTQEVFRKKYLPACHCALNFHLENLLHAAALQSHHLVTDKWPAGVDA